GAPDVIASGNQVDEVSVFSVLRNRGDGSFEAERLFETRFGETLYDIGNLDNDRAPDLVASDYWSNGIVVHRGDDSTFYETATHGGPSFIVDYDHDGKADVVSLSYGSGNPVRLHLFHGNADGTFRERRQLNTPAITQLAAVHAADLDGDGHLDIVVSDFRTPNLYLFRGENDAIRINAGGPVNAFAIADVNGDGRLDLVTV